MTETRYRSNIGIYAVLILILFAAATMSDDSSADETGQPDPASGANQIVLAID